MKRCSFVIRDNILHTLSWCARRHTVAINGHFKFETVYARALSVFVFRKFRCRFSFFPFSFGRESFFFLFFLFFFVESNLHYYLIRTFLYFHLAFGSFGLFGLLSADNVCVWRWLRCYRNCSCNRNARFLIRFKSVVESSSRISIWLMKGKQEKKKTGNRDCSDYYFWVRDSIQCARQQQQLITLNQGKSKEENCGDKSSSMENINWIRLQPVISEAKTVFNIIFIYVFIWKFFMTINVSLKVKANWIVNL